ncbi:hypothetical protein [Aliikangiella coralliicola]|uniref:Uncharacterized protein n=1 Tax=Aliikangiella coralliicola TaxID=2592383 RepID=A0A545UFX4_9GAMM|nr:hypothetical protein [Aliikangiella coralliicola]TQV88293.1 hypothetical protein FLL46_07125 [Aliikangiella coralliicola]
MHEEMSSIPEKYWQPRVVRHTAPNGTELFGIHEIYFKNHGEDVEGVTQDSLSNKFESVELLAKNLRNFINSGEEYIQCGDRNYKYYLQDVERWLEYIDASIIDYFE